MVEQNAENLINSRSSSRVLRIRLIKLMRKLNPTRRRPTISPVTSRKTWRLSMF